MLDVEDARLSMSLTQANASTLLWSHESFALAFVAKVEWP